MPNYNISINKELSDIVDREMKRSKFANRSEFFRELIRRSYVIREPYTIEPLAEGDEDAKILRSRKRNPTFINLADLLS